MANIDKKSLEHLASLARIELDPNDEDGLVTDLQNILNHFEELQAINTNEVLPMTGGTSLKNIFRADAVESTEGSGELKERIKKSFPESAGSLLVIPPVFDLTEPDK